MPARPSKHEICKKVTDALVAIEAGRRFVAVHKHLAGDRVALGVEDETALWELVAKLLREIQQAGPVAYYAGTRPPQRSYEPEIEDQELWAYRWNSTELGREMYLKFAMVSTKNGWVYAHVDCHEHRPQKGKR